MTAEDDGSAPSLLARDEEIAQLERFLLTLPQGLAGVLVEGPSGIGRTAVWAHAVRRAGDLGYHVLRATPAEGESRLSFSALGDLLRPALTDVLPILPAPQRRAIEVAMLLEEAKGEPPNPLAVGLGLRGVLAALAAERPCVIAIDDVHWVDPASLGALGFAARRLADAPIGLLASAPSGSTTVSLIHTLLPADRVRRVRLGPLPSAALANVLRARTGTHFPRHVLARICRETGGNPVHAIEVARELQEAGRPALSGDPLPVPSTLAALLRGRLQRLPAPSRQILLVAAEAAEPTVALLERVAGLAAEDIHAPLESAEAAGVIEIRDGRIHFTPPLTASVLSSESGSVARRRVHRLLAGVSEGEERALHLSVAVEAPDAAVAADIERAARNTRARGAPGAAGELMERAAALTPTDLAHERHRRFIEAAECHLDAADGRRARKILEGVLGDAADGPIRASALERLGWVRYHEEGWPSAADLFGQAGTLADDASPLGVSVALDRSVASLLTGNLSAASDLARQALEGARATGQTGLLADATALASSIDFLMGQGADQDAMERALELESWEVSRPTPVRPSVAVGLMLKWAGDLSRARDRLAAAHRQAVETGTERSLPFLLYHLSELECRAGNWALAEEHADGGCRIAEATGQDASLAFTLYAQALVDAHRGRVARCNEAAERGLALAERSGAVPARMLLASVLGFLELSLGNPGRAHGHLAPLAEAALTAGIAEPGVVRFAGDAIEAFAAIGDLESADVLLDRFEDRARALDRAWAKAVAARGRGMVATIRGDQSAALEALEQAMECHRDVYEPFERARTLLTLGSVQRRALNRRQARHTLDEALEIFRQLGAPLWAEKATTEISRISGRTPGTVTLTPTEERIASLVVQGRSNREVADSLFLTVKTVEWNLSRIYRKLGIRSRVELARWLDAPGSSLSSPSEMAHPAT